MIHAFITFCMILWPKTCQTIELMPEDGHPIASLMECMQAGMMGSTAEFTYGGDRWQTKGLNCREDPSEVTTWLDHQTVVPDAR